MRDGWSTSKLPRKLSQLLSFGVPAILALMAGLGFLIWVFGASAISGSVYAHGWTVGFWALLLYAGAYQVLIICVLICWMAKWPLVGLLHQVIWVATGAFVLTMVYVAVQLDWIAT